MRGMVRDIRNVAASPERPDIIEYADGYDLVFKTVHDGAAIRGEHDAPRARPLLPRRG